MLRAGAIVAVVAGMVLWTTFVRLAGEESDGRGELPKGTKAVACKISKDLDVFDRAEPGMQVDIVGEISEPIKTGIALLNVELLAVDGVAVGKEREPRTVVVLLTPVQWEVLALMKKHGTKLAMKLQAKGKPK